jgi:hypothetical protein
LLLSVVVVVVVVVVVIVVVFAAHYNKKLTVAMFSIANLEEIFNSYFVGRLV